MNQSPALRDVRLSNVSMASLPGCGGRGDTSEGVDLMVAWDTWGGGGRVLTGD